MFQSVYWTICKQGTKQLRPKHKKKTMGELNDIIFFYCIEKYSNFKKYHF